MADSGFTYRLPGAMWSLEFPPEAVKHLQLHAQRHRWSKESVGQLYSADLSSSIIRVDAVTTLSSTWSSYAGVRLDMPAVHVERTKMFETGLHCLGFWHSHPQSIPEPSAEDIAMAADHARAGAQEFAGIVFVIIGTAPAPNCLGVWVHDGMTLWHATRNAE